MNQFGGSNINYYQANWAKYVKETINLDMSEMYNFFLPELKGTKILDFGCGSGRDSLYFQTLNYDVVSSEPSENLRIFAADLLNKPVLKINYKEIGIIMRQETKDLDGIWACASLIHCPKENMKDLLNRLSGLLKEDGIIYCSFINEQSEKMIGDRFYNSYSIEPFNYLIYETKGLYIYKYEITKDKRKDKSDREWLNVLLKKDQSWKKIISQETEKRIR